MSGDVACILLTFASIAVGAWVFAVASNARLARKIETLSLDVLRLTRRVEAAERRAEAAPALQSPENPERAPASRPEASAAPATAERRTTPAAPPIAVPPAVPPPPPVAAPDASPRATPPARREPVHAAAGAPPPVSGRPGAGSVEAFVGGRVLLIVGVIAVLFGLGYFLKYAIERQWIGHAPRVAIGTVAGVAALVAGDRLRGRGFNVFGQALMGLGLGALYLCDYFAAVRYDLYPRTFAFGVAALVTAAGALLAVRREAPVLAWLGFAGAFLAPWLLGRNQDDLELLTLWLAVVDFGVAATLVLRAWHGLDVLAATGTMAYFLAWKAAHLRDERLGAASVCLAVCVGVILLTTFVPAALARRRIAAPSFAAAGVACVIGYGAAYDLLFPAQRAAFGAVSLGFAVLLAALAELHRARVRDAAADVESVRAFALAVLGAAVPVIFRGTGVAPAWSALGAACVHAGTRVRREWLVAAGFVGISLASADVLLDRAGLSDARGAAVFAGGFVSALSPCVAFAAAAWSLRRARTADTPPADVSMTAAAWGAVALLAQETWRAFAPEDAADASRIHALLATTCAVAVFGVAVAALVRRREGLGALPAWGPLALVAALGVAVLGAREGGGFTPVGNERFLAGALVVLALGAAAFIGPRPGDLPGVGAAVHLFALVTSEIVAWESGGGTPGLAGAERDFRMHVVLWLCWTAYGAVASELGVRLGRTWLVGFGMLAMLLAAGDALLARVIVDAPPFGAGFVLAFVPFVALLAAPGWLRRDAARSGAPGAGAGVPAYVGVAYLFVLVTIEILAWGERGGIEGTTRADLRFQAQVALSVFWAAYAASLVALGFWRRLEGLRWAGIGVFLLTVGKVFLVDLARLDTAYRVGSFLVLGLLLVGASFLYQRRRRGDAAAGDSAQP